MNWEYVSGFFDANGYITFTKPSKNTKKTIVFGFTNTKREILDEIQNFILTKTKQKGFISEKKSKIESHSNSYDLKYTFLNKALLILPNINSRHLKKTHRINLTLTKLKQITPRNGRYTDEILNLRQQFEFDFFNPKVS